MKSIYLCGPISGCSYGECTDWRKYVARHIAPDIIALSPMRGKKYLEHEKEIGHSYEETIMSSAQAITSRDRFDVMNCDMLFANFLGAKKVSVGSVIELGWADAFRKPVILIMEPDGSNIHEHPIVERITGFRVATIDEAITLVNATLSMNFAKENQ
jgi:nucleoside 2-deoxyribosyltransferase